MYTGKCKTLSLFNTYTRKDWNPTEWAVFICRIIGVGCVYL